MFCERAADTKGLADKSSLLGRRGASFISLTVKDKIGIGVEMDKLAVLVAVLFLTVMPAVAAEIDAEDAASHVGQTSTVAGCLTGSFVVHRAWQAADPALPIRHVLPSEGLI